MRTHSKSEESITKIDNLWGEGEEEERLEEVEEGENDEEEDEENK